MINVEKRGVALIWAIVMSMILISLGTIMSSQIITESKMILRADDSLKAYSAAKSGVEWAKDFINKEYQADGFTCGGTGWNGSDLTGPNAKNIKIDGISTKVSISSEVPGGLCPSHGKIFISSLATLNGVNRQIDYTVAKPTMSTVDKDNDVADDTNINKVLSVSGSFVEQFDFWTNGQGFWIGEETIVHLGIGLEKTTNKTGIYFRLYDKDRVVLIAMKDGKVVASSRDICISNQSTSCAAGPDIDLTKSKAIRVRIKYIDNTGAKIYVYRKDYSNGNYTLLQTESITIPEGKFTASDFKYFSFTPALSVVTYSNVNPNPDDMGDNRFYKLNKALTAAEAYLDTLRVDGITF